MRNASTVCGPWFLEDLNRSFLKVGLKIQIPLFGRPDHLLDALDGLLIPQAEREVVHQTGSSTGAVVGRSG